MCPGRSGQPRVDLVETPTRPHRSERRGQSALRGGCVVDVVGRHALDSLAVGDLDECIVAGGVEGIAVVPQLHQHAVTSERVDQPEQLAASCRRTVGDERCRDRSLAAPGEHPGVTGDGVGHVGERELRGTLLACEMPGAECPGQPGIPGGTVGEHEQVDPRRIGGMGVGDHTRVDLTVDGTFGSGNRSWMPRQPDLGPEHGRQADRLGRLGEAHDPVEAVVVGDRQRVEAEPGRLGGQFFGVRSPVEEREVRVAVQLGVRGGRCVGGTRQIRWRLEGLALATPRGAVPTRVPRWTSRGASVSTGRAGLLARRSVRQGRFEFAP